MAEEPDMFPPTGGMWLPSQIPLMEGHLRSLGLEIDPKELADPTSSTLEAIVSLGGCSGSFVSSNGLIITNHHCVEGYLSYITEQDKAALKKQNEERAAKGLPPIESDIDYMRDGYDARNGGERFTGPESRVFITFEQRDVTERMTSGLAAIEDPLERSTELEKRQKQLLKEAETDPSIRAEVKSFFRGEKFMLILKRKLKDLRMVYAPPKAVGYFGGDERNWEFPRHVGDFAFLRVYTGPDGESADYSEDNIPYKPANIVPISQGSGGLSPGDLVFVAGYPGRTNRATTFTEASDTVARSMPYTIDYLDKIRAVFRELESRNEVLATKVQPPLFGIENYLKNNREALQILDSIDYLGKKEQLQADLLAWVEEDPSRLQKYAPVLEKMDQIQAKYQQNWQKRAFASRLFSGYFNGIVSSALTIVRAAKEKEKPDPERLPGYQLRDYENIRDELRQMQGTYSREIAVEVTTHFMQRLLAAEGKNPGFVEAFLGGVETEDEIRARVQKVLDATKLEDVKTRLELFESASYADLKASDDPLIQFAVLAEPDLLAAEEHAKEQGGESLMVAPLYIEMLRNFLLSRGQVMAPDANSTLRITFGQVGGYTKQDGESTTYVPAFTNIRQLVEDEHQPGKKDFEVPQRWIEAYERAVTKGFGPYADPFYGSLPLNFLANVDTTGGNSGSAALNARGELIGLLFDGNTDSLYGDYVFDEGVRSILLDIRYTLWVLDEVERNGDLLRELGVKPSFAP
ncbi:MAG TPA: S46 family peptidase [Planctomycetaceae bacterium]|nr:S46 family peptidase [Planctomycetaceae bacterium]